MALQKLRDYFNETNRESFMSMLNQKVHVVEKIAASSFHVRRDDLHNKYYKSGSEKAMDIVDRTVVKFYENAIRHFQGLKNEVKNEMPRDWKFGFDYLIDNETPNFKYSLLPKNNLILTHIQVLNESGKVSKVIRDTEVLNKWAKKLDVQKPPIVFEGLLAGFQKEALVKLLEMNDIEFEKVYENRSFTRDIYNIFNSGLSQTALNESINEDIDGLIVSFVDGKTMKSFKLEDFRRTVTEKKERKSSDVYQITMVDVIEYFSSYDFSKHKLVEEKKDKRFIELMSEAFNDYIKSNAAKYIGVKFDTAEFAKNEAFQLNTSFIKNEKTLRYVNNPILAELFKIMLSSFRSKREKASDILTDDMVNQMNEIIDNVYKQVDAKLEENEVLDFNSFKKWSTIQEDKPEDINEALKVKTVDNTGEKVNMFVGRFQPFTLGHAKVLESLHKQNGYPVVVFLVKSKTAKAEDALKRPYDENTQLKMFRAVQKQYKFLKDIIVVPFAAIDVLFNELRPKYEPVLWGTGTDRMAAYSSQAYKDTYRQQLNVLPEFGMHEIHRTDDDISATAVRNAMIDDDKREFERMTPKSLHSMYAELKDKLEKAKAGVVETRLNESTLTFEQFINQFK